MDKPKEQKVVFPPPPAAVVIIPARFGFMPVAPKWGGPVEYLGSAVSRLGIYGPLWTIHWRN